MTHKYNDTMVQERTRFLRVYKYGRFAFVTFAFAYLFQILVCALCLTSRMASSEKSSDKNGNDQVDPEKQKYVAIKEQTAASITTQGNASGMASDQYSSSNSVLPTNQQQSALTSFFPFNQQQQQQPQSSNRPSRRRNGYSSGMFLMFHPNSGRMGFEPIKMADELPLIETIRDMITYETRLRLSEPIQQLIDMYHEDETAVA